MTVAVLLLSAVAQAETAVGQVVFVKGIASIQHVAGAATPAAFGDSVQQLDTLQTAKGELRVLFDDKTLLTLGANSKVLVSEHVYKPAQRTRRSLFEIVTGTVRAIVDQPTALRENNIRLQTPTAVAGIRGTDAGVNVTADAAQFVCFNGLFEAHAKTNPRAGVRVKTGYWTEIRGDVPTPPAPITATTMQPFSGVLNKDELKDILKQSGAVPLTTPPPSASGTTSPQAQPQQTTPPPPAPEQPTQPVTPPMVPGGTTNTPSDAANTGPVTAPLTFPQ